MLLLPEESKTHARFRMPAKRADLSPQLRTIPTLPLNLKSA